MALRAFGSGVVVLDHDLFVPFRARRVGLVASEADRETALFYIILPRILRVFLARAMAAFTGKTLVLVLQQFLIFVRMAFLTCLFAGVNPVPGRQFRERRTPIPSILPE